MTRICRVCGVKKPLTDFPSHKTAEHNREHRCKTCKATDNRRRRSDPAIVAAELATRQDWYKARGGKQIVRRNTKAHRQRSGYPGWSDPLRKRARNLAQAAIRRGRLVRQPCERCGMGDTHAHHDDYSAPLNVRWFCESCHRLEHQAIRALPL